MRRPANYGRGMASQRPGSARESRGQTRRRHKGRADPPPPEGQRLRRQAPRVSASPASPGTSRPVTGNAVVSCSSLTPLGHQGRARLLGQPVRPAPWRAALALWCGAEQQQGSAMARALAPLGQPACQQHDTEQGNGRQMAGIVRVLAKTGSRAAGQASGDQSEEGGVALESTLPQKAAPADNQGPERGKLIVEGVRPAAARRRGPRRRVAHRVK